MNFKLEGFNTENEKIELSKPVWFEFLIGNFGTDVKYRFIFLKPIPNKISKLKIQLNNEQPQIFIVDKIKETYYNNKSKISSYELVVSSPISLIWQNFVQPETFEKLSVQNLFEKFCKPFKIESISQNLLNCQPTNFFTTLGMTYWDVVCIFFRKVFNTTIFVNQNKQLTTKFKPQHTTQLSTSHPNLTLFKNLTDRTKLISTIMVQLPDDNSNSFIELKHSNIISEQLKINRIKYFKLPKQFDMLPNKGAKSIITKHNTSHKTIELEFAEILTPLWPGSVVKLIDKNRTVDVCVSEFYCALLKNGPVSKIKLHLSELI